MRIHHVYLIYICTALASTTASGQWESDTAFVSAQRIAAPVSATGRSVVVITSEQLEQSTAHTVDEYLRLEAGINVNTRHPYGVQSDIGIRGSSFSQVLVLMDDIRVNDPLTAHFNHQIPIPLSEIELIEIVRGPASTVYGADAVGGVVHIRTKTYANSKKAQGSMGSAGMGKDGLLIADGVAYQRLGKTLISIGARHARANGATLTNPNFEAGTSPRETYRPYFAIGSYSAALQSKLSPSTRVYGRIALDRRSFSAKYFYTRSALDESTEETSGLWTQIAVKTLRAQGRSEWQLHWRRSTDLFTFNPSFAPNDHKMNQYVASSIHESVISSRLRLGYGGQAVYRTIQSSDRGEHKSISAGVYGTFIYAPVDALSVSGGLRTQYDDNYDLQLLPQLAVSYQVHDWTLRASYGKAVRAPDFTERYIATQISELSSGRTLGRPDLQEEVSYSVDIGTDYRARHIQMSFSLFSRTGRDLIDYILTPASLITTSDALDPAGDYFYASNLSRASTHGVEFSLAYKFQLSERSTLQLLLDYTYLRSRSGSELPSRYLANHPQHMLRTGLRYSGTHMSVSYDMGYQNRDPEALESSAFLVPESYALHHLRTDVFIIDTKIGVYGQVYNLWNADVQEILGAQLPGRWLQVGLKWSISSQLLSLPTDDL